MYRMCVWLSCWHALVWEVKNSYFLLCLLSQGEQEKSFGQSTSRVIHDVIQCLFFRRRSAWCVLENSAASGGHSLLCCSNIRYIYGWRVSLINWWRCRWRRSQKPGKLTILRHSQCLVIRSRRLRFYKSIMWYQSAVADKCGICVLE